MNIAETFLSIQAEGRHTTTPALFIRISGCNRRCSFCDSKYAWEDNLVVNLSYLRNLIFSSDRKDVIITGGEPLTMKQEVFELVSSFPSYRFHLETNGDLAEPSDIPSLKKFFYIAFSPKDHYTAERLSEEILSHLDSNKYDVKIITDLVSVGVDLIPFATMLMPLTTENESKNIDIKKRVWLYCAEQGLRCSLRLHVDVFGVNRRWR